MWLLPEASAARSRVHEVEIGVAGGVGGIRVFGAGGASGDEAYGAGDEGDAGPAVEGEMLVEPEAAEERDDDVTEGSGGHDEGEVGPGERGHVTGEESDEEHDAGGDEGVEERVPEERQMVEIDGADLGHASGEERVADRCGEHDSYEDGVLRGS
jgi:hypothetical protein